MIGRAWGKQGSETCQAVIVVLFWPLEISHRRILFFSLWPFLSNFRSSPDKSLCFSDSMGWICPIWILKKSKKLHRLYCLALHHTSEWECHQTEPRHSSRAALIHSKKPLMTSLKSWRCDCTLKGMQKARGRDKNEPNLILAAVWSTESGPCAGGVPKVALRYHGASKSLEPATAILNYWKTKQIFFKF